MHIVVHNSRTQYSTEHPSQALSLFPSFTHNCLVGMEVMAQLHFHAPRLIRRIAV